MTEKVEIRNNKYVHPDDQIDDDDKQCDPDTATKTLIDRSVTEKSTSKRSLSSSKVVELRGSGLIKTTRENGKRRSGASEHLSTAEQYEQNKNQTKQGLTRNLVGMSLVILIGNTFLYGYNLGVLNQPAELIQQFYNRTYTTRNEEEVDVYMLTFLWSLTTSIFLPAGMIGAYSAGFLADRLGRKRTVMLSCVPAIIGGALSTACVTASSPELLMIGRFIVGLSCGISTQICPMYIMEICPVNLRGGFGTASQLFCTLGIFVASVLGLREVLGTEDRWPYLLLVNVLAGLFCSILMLFLPDSPRFLMITRNNQTQAEKALRFIRQQRDVSEDIEEMLSELNNKQQQKYDDDDKLTMMKFIRTKSLHKPLIIVIVLQAAQQLSGINAIFFYSNSIFLVAGVSRQAIQYAVILTCAINVIMTIITVPLMDRSGRRPLLLYPMFVMILILALIVAALKYQSSILWFSYISIACVIGYVICFAVGLGPIPAILSAELFRQETRHHAMSLTGLVNWFSCMSVGISFELLQKLMREFTFLIYLVLMIGFTSFVYFKVPETKNMTFDQIAALLQKEAGVREGEGEGLVERAEELKTKPIYKSESDCEGVDTVDDRKDKEIFIKELENNNNTTESLPV